MLILAAVWMGRRLVQAALISYLVFQIPHTVFHLGADDVLPTGDRVASNMALGLARSWRPAFCCGWLAIAARPETSQAPAQGNGTARIAPRTKGMLARFGSWYARREYGNEVTPGGVFAHHPKLAMGYGGFELALDRSDTVPAKLKALGEIKAATVVNCEWCMDFGSMIGREHGVTDEQLREMPRHRESPAFDGLERLVLDYATAMSHTPAEVDDELFARLREHFDDAQLVELTSAIAIENFRARFNHATGMAAQGFSEGMVCVVPETSSATPA